MLQGLTDARACAADGPCRTTRARPPVPAGQQLLQPSQRLASHLVGSCVTRQRAIVYIQVLAKHGSMQWTARHSQTQSTQSMCQHAAASALAALGLPSGGSLLTQKSFSTAQSNGRNWEATLLSQHGQMLCSLNKGTHVRRGLCYCSAWPIIIRKAARSEMNLVPSWCMASLS